MPPALFWRMARLPRVVAVDTPHHVTQRGNARQFILESDTDRAVYLDLLQRHCRLHRLAVAGYCLMSNHIHLIVIPRRPESLALALRNAHGRYAAYFNARHGSSGHVWQGRFYSCPLDTAHFWAALRYVERNPLRAGLAAAPEDWPWSTAAIHCGGAGGGWLDSEIWQGSWTPGEWRDYLRAAPDGDGEEIRRSTHTGRPLGSADFVRTLERSLRRRLAAQPGGRPPKQTADEFQAVLEFAGK